MTRHQINNRGTGTARIENTSSRHVVTSRSPSRIIIGESASAPVTPPPSLVSPPIVTGIMRIGEILTSTTGVWADASSYAFQWTRDGVPILGATLLTYTVTGSDIASLVACTVTATGPGGVSSPEASNVVESVWRAILVLKPSALIWDGRDPYCYGGAYVGAPVAEIRTVNGIVLGSQVVTSRMGTRGSSHLTLDGVDDHYVCDPHASKLRLAHTVIAGFSNPDDATTNVRTLFCASSTSSGASSQQVSVNFSRPSLPNATRQRYAVGDASFITISLMSYAIGAGPYDLACRAAAPGGAMSAVRMDGSLTSIGTGTRSADNGIPFSWLYLGCRALAATPSLAQYWQGDIRHIALDASSWSDAELLAYRTCALNAGVM